MYAHTRKLLPWEALAEAGAVPILLIRHAQTAWNAERRFQGISDLPLDETGRAQAAALGRAMAGLPLSALYTSPLRRARETAASVAAGRDLDPAAVPGLMELNQGELEGEPASALPSRYPDFLKAWIADPGAAAVPGGESLGQVQARALAGLIPLLQAAQPGPPVAVVTHQMVISSLICHSLSLPLRYYGLIRQPNTAINLLAWRDGALALARVNVSEHLSPAPPAQPS